MNEKLYILHYPSSFGMGSDVDDLLLTEDGLRRIIRIELENKRSGINHFDDRMTGTWNQEVFCDSTDEEEVIQDVIHKRRTTCSTYARTKDLTPIPRGVPVSVSEKRFENTVFHLWNQFDCMSDIIAGETVFRRYHLDLTEHKSFAGIESGFWYEFTSFTMKHALLQSYFMFSDKKDAIKMHEGRIERCKAQLDGTYKPGNEHYVDDFIKVDEFNYKAWIADSEAALKKLRRRIRLPDEYLTHLHKDNFGKWFSGLMKSDLEKMRQNDYTKMVYDYPIVGNTIGIIMSPNTEPTSNFVYDELFVKGADVEYIPASWTGRAATKRGLARFRACAALFNTFACD